MNPFILLNIVLLLTFYLYSKEIINPIRTIFIIVVVIIIEIILLFIEYYTNIVLLQLGPFVLTITRSNIH